MIIRKCTSSSGAHRVASVDTTVSSDFHRETGGEYTWICHWLPCIIKCSLICHTQIAGQDVVIFTISRDQEQATSVLVRRYKRINGIIYCHAQLSLSSTDRPHIFITKFESKQNSVCPKLYIVEFLPLLERKVVPPSSIQLFPEPKEYFLEASSFCISIEWSLAWQN